MYYETHLKSSGIGQTDQDFYQTSKERPKATIYKTSNSSYSPYWKILHPNEEATQDPQFSKSTNNHILTAQIPTISEQNQASNELKKKNSLYKNTTVAQKFHEVEFQMEPDSLTQVPQKVLKVVKQDPCIPILVRDFPVKPEMISYPDQGLNIGNKLYETSSKEIGALKPSDYEIPDKYHPVNRTFTRQFGGGTFKYNGLNTAATFSKVHQNFNEF